MRARYLERGRCAEMYHNSALEPQVLRRIRSFKCIGQDSAKFSREQLLGG